MKKLKQSKIRDNASCADLSKTVYGMQGISLIVGFLAKIGIIKNPKLVQVMKEVPKIVEQTERMINLPDKFNDHFSSIGWIAYESMKVELMEKCVKLAENGKMDEAEKLLIEYFDEKNIKTHIMWLKAIKAFLPRWELTQNACADYVAGRYYSSIPIILLTIDGLVNDVAPDQKGFFASNPDVTAWDSIAGHSSGLKKLAEIFGTTRKKTTIEELKIPYRNGIIHGRDINYANKIVAAKVWSALFAVGDWAKQVQAGKKDQPKEKEKKTTWKEIFKQLQNNEAQKKLISKWKARKLTVGKDFSQSGMVKDYENESPEQAVVAFIDFLSKKNYGEMAKKVTNLQSFSHNKKAGELRTKYRNVEVQKFSINEIIDEAPAISEVKIVLDYKNDSQTYSKEITVRMIFQDDKNNPLVRGSVEGSWKILERCFDSIIY
jgi:hypothetical protein